MYLDLLVQLFHVLHIARAANISFKIILLLYKNVNQAYMKTNSESSLLINLHDSSWKIILFSLLHFLFIFLSLLLSERKQMEEINTSQHYCLQQS